MYKFTGGYGRRVLLFVMSVTSPLLGVTQYSPTPPLMYAHALFNLLIRICVGFSLPAGLCNVELIQP